MNAAWKDNVDVEEAVWNVNTPRILKEFSEIRIDNSVILQLVPSCKLFKGLVAEASPGDLSPCVYQYLSRVVDNTEMSAFLKLQHQINSVSAAF